MLGRPVRRDDVEPYSWFVVLQAEEPPVVFEEYLKATGWLNQWARRVAQMVVNGIRPAAHAYRLGTTRYPLRDDASGR